LTISVIVQIGLTLYFEVDDKSDNRPGTEQNTSLGETMAPAPEWSLPPFIPAKCTFFLQAV